MQEGAYRFIRNPNVSAEAIRKAGAMQTVKLAQEFPELLAIEDTTSLSYRHQVSIHRNSIDTGKMRRSSLDPTFLLA